MSFEFVILKAALMIYALYDIVEDTGTALPEAELPVDPGSEKSPWPSLWHAEVVEHWRVKLEIRLTNAEWLYRPEVDVELSSGVRSVNVNNALAT